MRWLSDASGRGGRPVGLRRSRKTAAAYESDKASVWRTKHCSAARASISIAPSADMATTSSLPAIWASRRANRRDEP